MRSLLGTRAGLRGALWLAALLAVLVPAVGADEAKPAAPGDAPERTVAELTELVRKSVVVVSYAGRDGRQAGLGAGFIISPDGLIATNLHVIGEARPITVTTADGAKYDVTAIHATERAADLAVLRIDAKDLPALPLGDSDTLKQGQEIVALGNPRGLETSVVSGVVSGRREIDGKSMIQLAIAIEQGNSGGPLLDRAGRVHGLLTLKSVVTENLGFAMPINLLKPLLAKPNPVPMSRWLTIGALDSKSWNALFGARWRQRAGRIVVDGAGDGFGGRSLCLAQRAVPDLPYELAVEVRLDNEDGAAGLVFHADGKNAHYGFYPSNGRLRLSRFDGPDVYSWNVLREVPSRHYRPGEWNQLKVRVESGKIECFVNEEPVIESTDGRYAAGAVGLAKFRDTRAEFRNFEVGAKIASRKPSTEVRDKIARAVNDLDPSRPPSAEMVERLLAEGSEGTAALRERAELLEQQSERLKQLARAVHQKKTRDELIAELSRKEEEIDLLRAALLVARIDNEEVDVDTYLAEAGRIAAGVAAALPADATGQQKLELLDKEMFQTLGFHGSRVDYYNKSNSYLNEVIDDREGLPITLSVLYLEMARRIGVTLEGIGLPGHFIVRYAPPNGPEELIDVFDGGKRISRADAEERVRAAFDRPPNENEWRPQRKREIVSRMVQNLLSTASDMNDAERVAACTETLVALHPDSVAERWFRAVALFRTGRIDEARADADWLLERDESELRNVVDAAQVRALRRLLDESDR